MMQHEMHVKTELEILISLVMERLFIFLIILLDSSILSFLCLLYLQLLVSK